MSHYLSRILRSDLFHNTSRLFAANVLAQVIGLFVYPFLTRLYSESDFGLFNLFMSIGGVVAVVSTAEWQNAIPLPRSDSSARGVFHAGVLTLMLVVAVLCLLLPFSHPIADLFDAPEIASYLWLLPLYIMGLGGWQLLNGWYTRRKMFVRISTYQISQNLLSAIMKLILGVAGVCGGLLYGSVAAPVVAAGIIIAWTYRKHLRFLIVFNRQECHEAAHTYRKFPFFSMPRALVNTLSGNLPVFLLSPHFGLAATGLLGMAFTIALRPLTMITGSVSQVLLQRFAFNVSHKQSVRKDFIRYLALTTGVILPVFAVLYFILPWLTALLFGAQWRETGELVRLMLPWLMLVVIGGGISFVPDLFGRQHISMWIEYGYIVLRVAALLTGIFFNNFHMAVFLFSISGVIVIGGQLVWYAVMIKKFEKQNALG